MTHKIAKKIVSYKVASNEASIESTDMNVSKVDVESMHENLERPEILLGSTYKIKTPQYEHALYIPIQLEDTVLKFSKVSLIQGLW
jgi:hypothetical protein